MTDFFEGKVSIRHPDRFSIGGEWVTPSGSKRIELISPVTEQVSGTMAEADPLDVERAVAAARQAFDHGRLWRLQAVRARAGGRYRDGAPISGNQDIRAQRGPEESRMSGSAR